MITNNFTPVWTFSLLAPLAVALPRATPPQPGAFDAAEVAQLAPHVDTALGALRAGSSLPSAPLAELERDALACADQRNADLYALRAGLELSNNEWKWLAIGAGIVLLIVLL